VRIGHLTLDNGLVFAPLAGITNLPLRLLAKEAGCGMVCSEMVSANGLVHGSEKTEQLMATVPEEYPLSIQLFGSEPSVLAEAARRVEDAGAAVLDINFGCAVKKILKSGSGAALMRTPERAARLLAGVRRAVGIPLTIKIRSGWTADGRQALEIARIAQDCGVDAITVHPRTAAQGFGGVADWTVIAAVKQAVSVTVIGNGDIVSPGDAGRMLAQTGCDGVMVGRAAIGNPHLFRRILGTMEGADPGPIRGEEVLKVANRYVEDSIRYLGEDRACRLLRSRLNWFVRGLPRAKRFRESVKRVSSRREVLEMIDRYRRELAAVEAPPRGDGG
jgi:nifR3 family TIM-barrel protein